MINGKIEFTSAEPSKDDNLAIKEIKCAIHKLDFQQFLSLDKNHGKNIRHVYAASIRIEDEYVSILDKTIGELVKKYALKLIHLTTVKNEIESYCNCSLHAHVKTHHDSVSLDTKIKAGQYLVVNSDSTKQISQLIQDIDDPILRFHSILDKTSKLISKNNLADEIHKMDNMDNTIPLGKI